MPRDRRVFDSIYAIKYPALAGARRRRNGVPAHTPPPDFTTVTLGVDSDGAPVRIDEKPRLEHLHAIGATGSGKTTFLAHLILQDVRRGRGGIVMDPHGSHRDSLYHHLLATLEADGFTKSGRLHVLDPNISTHVVGFNPLAALPDTDEAVIADAMVEAFERVWGDEDSHATPTIRSILKATFTALSELRLPLTAAKQLYDPNDRYGLRARLITKLDSTYARDELERLHQTALDEKSHRDFRAEVKGPINRINEFVSSRAIELMLGQSNPARTLDLLQIMDRGHILLVNLQHGTAVSAANTRLLGALLLRYLFLLAGRRRHYEPFFVTIDECHQYLTGDVPSLLAEVRKYGIAMTLAHQFLTQLGKPDDLVAQALLNSTEIKAVFRVKSPTEAQQLAEMVVPLDLETPVKALIKPTVVDHEIMQLNSTSAAQHAAESVSTSESETEAETEGIAYGSMQGAADTTTSAQITGEGVGQVFTPEQGWLTLPELMSQSDSASSAHSQVVGSSSSHGSNETESYARSRGRGQSRAKGRAQGRSAAHGSSEALRPVFQDLPGAVHSKENLLYMAGEMIRKLSPGQAFIAFRGRTTLVSIPPLEPVCPPADGSSDPRTRAAQLLASSPHATPRDVAREAMRAEERQLLDPGSSKPEVDVASPEPMPPPDDVDVAAARFWEQRPNPSSVRRPPKLVIDNAARPPEEPPAQPQHSAPLEKAARQLALREFAFAVIEAARVMEMHLRAATGRNGGMTLGPLIETAFEQKLVPRHLHPALKKAVRVRNAATHENREPSEQQAHDILRTAQALITALTRRR